MICLICRPSSKPSTDGSRGSDALTADKKDVLLRFSSELGAHNYSTGRRVKPLLGALEFVSVACVEDSIAGPFGKAVLL